MRLFCLPFAGGGASAYRLWQKEVQKGIDICPIQLPGRETRMMEEPFTEMTRLVPAIAEAIKPLLDIPFAFFGHSMGALISFELARYMRSVGQPSPVHLFLSGYQAPPRPNKAPAISHLSNQKFVEGLRQFKFTPESVLANPEFLELLLPMLKADFSVYENYEYKVEPGLSSPITVFGGDNDELTDHEDLDSWRNHTFDFQGVFTFAGEHFYLMDQWKTLLHHISNTLLVSSSL